MQAKVRCLLKSQAISAQKVRPLLKTIRNSNVETALEQLEFLSMKTKAARLIFKALSSAVANAENNANLDIYSLTVSKAVADESFTLKRMRARAKGRGARIFKRRCHILIEVTENN